ncbi:MAG: hypothetical protein AB1416_02590, partial [Actinomycetota bacterium]
AGGASLVAAGLRTLRRAPGGTVPPQSVPEVLIVAERIAARRGRPALVEVPAGARDDDVLAAVQRGVEWVAAHELRAHAAEEAEDEAA